MAFGDWTTIADAPLVTALNVSTPIIGSGSYSLVGNTGTNDALTTYLDPLSFSKGFVKGRLRNILRRGTGSNGATTNDYAGFFYMASAVDLVNIGGRYNWAGLRSNGSVNDFSPEIRVQPTVNLARNINASTILADTAPVVTLLVGETLPIQVDWVLDIPNLGGIRHILSIGNVGDLDYSNLAVVYDLIDGSPLVPAPVNEGMFYRFQTSVGHIGVQEWWAADNTGVFQLV